MDFGTLHLRRQVIFVGGDVSVSAEAQATVTRDEMDSAAQCALLASEYITLNDAWRATSTGNGETSDMPHNSGNCALPRYTCTGVGGGRWCRFEGAGGDELPLTAPGSAHCNTGQPGWLSGWDEGGSPPPSYTGAGRYPEAAEGLVEMTVCFSHSDPCESYVVAGVIRCGGVLLWRLPDAGSDHAYCTAPSGLGQG